MIPFYIGVLGVLILLLVYVGFQGNYNYWKKQKVHVPGPKPLPILGNYKDYILLKKPIGAVVDNICKQFSNDPYIGVFYGPNQTLIVQDPGLLKIILTKDFYYFNGRETSDYIHNEPFGDTIFSLHGDRWKVIRQNLTPLFTSAKMKNMFHIIEKCALQLENLLENELKMDDVLEMRTLISRYTIDCVCNCGFGVDTNALGDNSNNPFRRIAAEIVDSSFKRGALLVGRSVWPRYFYAVGLTQFPVFVRDFFKNLLIDVYAKRGYKPTMRNDFVDLVMNLRSQKYITGDSISSMKSGEKKKVNIDVDDDFLTAQCTTFFGAGYETSATTSSLTLYELAKNQVAQERAYNEIVEYLKKNDNRVGYNCVTDLPYLEACIDEAMRLYPVLTNLTREVMEDYTLPDGVFLKKGTRIHIPVYTIQRKEEYFPNALQYQPERFLGDARKEIKPYTYMPFGEGPRICLGMRFSKMQSLPGLVTILKKYKLTLAEDMPSEIELEPKAFIALPKSGINIKFTPRQGWEERMFTRAN